MLTQRPQQRLLALSRRPLLCLLGLLYCLLHCLLVLLVLLMLLQHLSGCRGVRGRLRVREHAHERLPIIPTPWHSSQSSGRILVVTLLALMRARV